MTQDSKASRTAEGSSEDLPKVSIIIPCLNEAEFIGACLKSLLEGDYPGEKLEILVLDGFSRDGTRAIVRDFAAACDSVRLIDNPGGSKPRGMNRGIVAATGDVVVRVDAHARYAPDYVTILVKTLLETGAANVGGMWYNIPRSNSIMSRALAAVMSHPFGVGNASYRYESSSIRRTNIVPFMCVRRSLFDEVGLFDERLERGQDREFNLRIAASGGDMLIVPQAKCWYYVRSSLASFAHWAYVSGEVPFKISAIAGRNLLSLRNLAPAALLVGLASMGLLALVHPVGFYASAAIVGLYAVGAGTAGWERAMKMRDVSLAFTMPLAFAVLHGAYGLGSLRGLLAFGLPGLGRRMIVKPQI